VQTARAAAKSPGAAAAASGPYWVQVGAFKDPAAAKRLADKLRGENFEVEQSVKEGNAAAAPASAPGPTAGDRYNVFVSGTVPSEVAAKLTAKGLKAEPVAGGVAVTPSLPLRDAVALSKELAADGAKVQVRRAGAGATATVAATTVGPSAGGDALHRVRVGSFPDRQAAQAAAKSLEEKGYKGFIARGNP
jgi:hypothetical protein